MQRSLILAILTVVSLALPRSGFALCGDVNGDNKRTAADALSVLRSAVGQSVGLNCEAGRSQLRFYNAFTCSSGSQIATANFNGYDFSASAAQFSAYQTIDRDSISTIQVGFCGSTYNFPGPLDLAPDRRNRFLVVLLDPDIYGTANGAPAQFVMYDDGEPAAALLTQPLAEGMSSVDAIIGFGTSTEP